MPVYKYERKEILSYFDQFSDYEIDLTSYLTNFSQAGYPLTLSNNQPIIVKVKNIFSKIDTTIDLKNNPSDFKTHIIQDYEDAISISVKYFGTLDYWWLIYSLNKIYDPYKDWPLTNEEINVLTDTLYEKEGKYLRDTYYDLLFETNEKKRSILIPSIDIIVKILSDYNRIIQEYNE